MENESSLEDMQKEKESDIMYIEDNKDFGLSISIIRNYINDLEGLKKKKKKSAVIHDQQLLS